MLPICVRTERVWPKLSSIQGIRANLVYIVSLGVAGGIFVLLAHDSIVLAHGIKGFPFVVSDSS